MRPVRSLLVCLALVGCLAGATAPALAAPSSLVFGQDDGTPEPDSGTPTAGDDPLTALLDPDYALGGIVGTAGDVIPVGEPGEVSVVGYLFDDVFNSVIVLRNETGGAVGDIAVTLTVRDDDGELIAVGSSYGQRYPAYVPDGGIALTNVEFDGVDSIPADAEVTFEVEYGDPPDGSAEITENDIVIEEVTLAGDSLIGTGVNVADAEGIIPILLGACFDEDGAVTAALSGSVNPSTVEPGGDVTFSAELPEDGCNSYLISVVA